MGMIRVSEVHQAGMIRVSKVRQAGMIRVSKVHQAEYGYDQGQRGASGRVGSGSARCIRQGRIRVSRMLKDLCP